MIFLSEIFFNELLVNFFSKTLNIMLACKRNVPAVVIRHKQEQFQFVILFIHH